VIVHDPLYGRFELPVVSRTLIRSPEFRRLSEVRLLNCISPTLATLGEIKRYSHTLGVIHLTSIWSKLSERKHKEPELRALEAATLLHDVGTPPFGHLFEYILREKSGWHHEAIVNKILRGHHAPESTANQFFAGRTPEVYGLLHECNVDFNLLTQILDGSHPLSRLLFGSIDFDNLDNVARMAWALGIPGGATIAKDLASSLSITPTGQLSLCRSKRKAVVEWLALRRSVYEVLISDWPTVSAQAILTRAILLALKAGALEEHNWSMTDEELLSTLRSCRQSKDLVNTEYLGALPTGVILLHLSTPMEAFTAGSSYDVVTRIEQAAVEAGIARPLGFVLKDKGMLQKRLTFVDEDGEAWTEGETTVGTYLYVFSRSQGKAKPKAIEKLVGHLSQAVGFDLGNIIRVVENFGTADTEAQGRLV